MPSLAAPPPSPRRATASRATSDSRHPPSVKDVLRVGVLLVLVACLPAALSATTNTRVTPQPIGTETQPKAQAPRRNVMNVAFVNAGRAPGLEIWRVENFKAVKYPKTNYGKFYTGDSYILLNSKQAKSGDFSWDIHYWLGNETSQDESGAAAIMSVELDDQLGGGPVQHREVQEHESALFLSYFPTGIRYLSGGVASGFNHVDRNAVQKRLFQVKGKRNVRVRQVELNVSAMNKGDCFILDIGKDIYVYTGAKSSRTERLKAISAANQIRDQDHSGRSHVTVLDEFSTEHEIAKFFTDLGSGSPAAVADETKGGDDEQFERNQDAAVTLWKVSDASGSLKLTKIAEKPLNQNLLNPDELGDQDSFILDTVSSGLFVWIGKKATSAEKLEAMKKAQQFLVDNKYPSWTQIRRIVQEGEPSDFKQYFSNWRAIGDQQGLGRRHRREVIAASLPEPEFDERVLHAKRMAELFKSGGMAFGFMPDDGTGRAEIFRVEDFELTPVDRATYGMFFGGDSYVVKYTYKKGNKEGYVIYFWQGVDSTQDERAAAALHTVRLDNELSGKAIQVRVTQGNEPRHFLRIFKGKMVVFMGGRHSGFRNLKEHDTYDVDGTRLFHVRGTCDDDVRAVQVAEKAASLSSDDVFVLETPSATYLWLGKGASDDEKAMARNAVNLVAPGREPVSVAEGEEPAEFWNALGGKGPYSTHIDGELEETEPRLFHCRIKLNGRFSVEEIQNYNQHDLDEDDIMVLDSGEEIYVWVGSKSTEEEKTRSMEMAHKYLETDPSERTKDLALIFTVKQGEEPESFTSLFPSWNANYWESLQSYEDVKNEVHASNVS